jgi:excisionase family DNA binding protein
LASLQQNEIQLPEPLLSVDEVSEYLQIDPQTVRNWIEDGRPRGLYVGSRRVRIRESELERFISAGETDTRAPNTQGESVPDGLALAVAEVLRRTGAKDTAELVSTLRDIAAAAEKLADALKGQAETAGGE